MTKLVIFRIEKGNFEQGFPINLEIRENGKLCVPEVSGVLVSAPEIPDLYKEWQEVYNAWGKDPNSRWWRRQISVPPQTNSNYSSGNSIEQVMNAADRLELAFNNWLNSSTLEDIKEELLQTVGRDELVKFIIQTNNPELQKLPWELWRFLRRRYRHPEVALSSRRTPEKGALSLPVKILVILGSDDNIDINTDWNILQQRLGTAKLTLLEQPESETLQQTLQNHPWDIIFFAGHSSTEREGNDGNIWINRRENLSPQQLRNALEVAVINGLKLAIFNSCDGLGLARQLENLYIPHIIVMRQPIHDEVAQKFLNDFLTSFANGASLHRAVHEARDKLRLLDNRSPNASWLPVIFQNPEEPPLFYPQVNVSKDVKGKKLRFWRWSAIAFGCTLLSFVTWQYLLPVFFPQPRACDVQLNQNLPFSCGEKALMNPKEHPPQPTKQAGIKAIANHNYPQAVDLLTQAWREKKDPETLIYLNNAKLKVSNIHENNIYTIPLVVPISNSPAFVSENIVKGVAWLQYRFNNESENKFKIRVLLADDGNNIAQAQTIAKELGKRQDVLAVLGHYSSHLSTNVKSIYEQNELVLVSPTSTATDGLSSTHPNNIFFRPASTTQLTADPLVNYLIAKNYQNIAIFYTKGKAFSEASKKDFKTALNNKLKIVGDFELGEDIEKVRNNVTWIKQNFKDAAIVLLPDAYTTSNEPNNKVEVIKENNGELLILGSSTVSDDEVLALGKTALQNLVVSVPYYPSASNVKEFQNFWRNTELDWTVIMSYDALQMVIQAIQIQAKPSRSGIQKVLSAGFPMQGLSGTITLKGSDRQENTHALITPDCSSNPCSWRDVKN
ncbi:ABC transporter substrate-binding protein [Phormidium sp. LEGE 05292]|uniref:ABC transporter substrate-binding protein n=1 Tax=[Phormidium] sp. LEGE 05292 TaxID=767427 RepID=UPI00187E85BD|nr:ABC transporter substrate-binding protein [Phormidium sp. LEGE 05292]MBE9229337.1 ABC transporter substrate-binding protein [Phormidium sp. LEGE 05292]